MRYYDRAEVEKQVWVYTANTSATRMTSIFFINDHSDQVKICDALCDLVSFVQFKKREKHPWRCVTFSKIAG